MVTLGWVGTLGVIYLAVLVIRAGWRRNAERYYNRPDPKLVIKKPTPKFVGYDYEKAVAGKIRAAKRELDRLERARGVAPAEELPRLRAIGGRR